MNVARGVVISVHQLGATVRLEDGSLASIPAAEVEAKRSDLLRYQRQRETLTFSVDRSRRRPVAELALAGAPATALAPQPEIVLVDAAFEDRLAAYLKSTEEWAPPDRPAPAERHFIRKKRRAAYFDSRAKAP